MEEILKELVSSSEAAKPGKSLCKQQLYFNLNSARNWIQPNSTQVSSKLKKCINYAEKLAESWSNGFPTISEDSTVTEESTSDNKKQSGELLFGAVLLLDTIQLLRQQNCDDEEQEEQEELSAREFIRNLEAELIEHITPPDGLAMANLDHFVHGMFDITALVISLLFSTGNLALQPAKMIARCLKDEMLADLHNESEDVTVDPVECAFLVRLLFQVEESSEGTEELCEYLEDYLEQNLYLDEDQGVSPDAFLYFLSRAMAESSVETSLSEVLVEKLKTRLAEGFGFHRKSDCMSPSDLAMRIISLNLLGVLKEKQVLSSVTAGELKSLLKMQQSEGGWSAEGIFRFGDVQVGGSLICTLLCAVALESIMQCK